MYEETYYHLNCPLMEFHVELLKVLDCMYFSGWLYETDIDKSYQSDHS